MFCRFVVKTVVLGLACCSLAKIRKNPYLRIKLTSKPVKELIKRTLAIPYFMSDMVLVALIVLSLYPIPEIKPLGDVPLMDKWVHFVMYGGFSSCLWFDYYRQNPSRRLTWAAVIIAVVFPTVVGGLLELGQAYLTTCRSGDWLDFYANAIGVAIGFLVGTTLVWKFHRRRDEI